MGSSTTASDEDLVRHYQRGESLAFETLVERYSAPAVRFARHFTRESHAAEDLAQDVFVKLVTVLRGAGYDPGRGRFAPFFFRMIRNLAIDRYRSSRAEPLANVELTAPPAGQAPAILLQNERRDLINAILDKIPASERAAITLREFDGLSYKEIADALDAPVDSVKTWIFRARRRIEEAWLAMEVKGDTV
ncbi:MAG: RNA polymerase sigma factor [Planctomycetota bacterium]